MSVAVSQADLEALECMLDANETVLMECLRAVQSGEKGAKERVSLLQRAAELMCSEIHARFCDAKLDTIIAQVAADPTKVDRKEGANVPSDTMRMSARAQVAPSSHGRKGVDDAIEGTTSKHVWTKEEQATFVEVLGETSGLALSRSALVNTLHRRLSHLGKRQLNSHLQWWEKKEQKERKKEQKKRKKKRLHAPGENAFQ